MTEKFPRRDETTTTAQDLGAAPAGTSSQNETMASAARVINIVELLEAILLQSPMQDLLLAQRVNKQFKDTVENSSHLQRALFF